MALNVGQFGVDIDVCSIKISVHLAHVSFVHMKSNDVVNE